MKQILFNTEMVQAIMDGRKTVTRRVVKSNKFDLNSCCAVEISGNPYETRIDKHGCEYPFQLNGLYATFDDGKCFPLVKLPCQAGDILYVRETWAVWSRTEGTAPEIHYKADGEYLKDVKWRPSIHMPREAARLFLRVKDVRVERLQDIGGYEIIIKEGASPDPYDYQSPEWYDTRPELLTEAARAAFAGLWDSTMKHADRAVCGWDANPWVWVIEFERIRREEAAE